VGPARRRGVGALIIIVLILVMVITVMGLSQSFFSSHIVDKAMRSSAGNTALALAESAVQEALLAIQWEVNKPGSSYYEGFRRPVSLATGDDGFVVIVAEQPTAQLQLPATKRLLAQPAFAGYKLESVSADVPFRRPVAGLAYETSGLLRVAAKVSSDRPVSVMRGVEVYKDYKQVLVCPPRPFDQLSFFLNQPESLLGTSVSEANDRITRSYERLKRIVEDLEKLLTKAKEQASSAGGSVPSEIEDRVNQVTQKLKPWIPQSIDNPPTDETAFAHKFKEPLLLLSTADFPKLEELYLLPALQANWDTLKAAEDQIEKAQKDLEDYSGSDESEATDLGLKVIDAFENLGVRHHERIELYRKFQASFFEKSGNAFQLWQDAYLPKLQADKWELRATYKVDSQKAFDELWSRLGSRINGIVYATGPLKLPSAWTGKAVVVATQAIDLPDITIADKTRNQLSVVGFKQIKVEGSRCDAAILVAPSGELLLGGPVQFVGELVFAGELRRPETLKGSLQRNRYLFSGNTEDAPPKLDHFLVAISPQVRFRGVVRR
jgi:prefoldin subunit 5